MSLPPLSTPGAEGKTVKLRLIATIVEVLLIAAIAFFGFEVFGYAQARSAVARVSTAKIGEFNNKAAKRWMPEVKYEFDANGQSHSGVTWETSKDSIVEAQAYLDKHPVGSGIQVRYHPYAPNFNYPYDRFRTMFSMTIGGLISVIGFALLLSPLLSIRITRKHTATILRVAITIVCLSPIPACLTGSADNFATIAVRLFTLLSVSHAIFLWSASGRKVFPPKAWIT